MRLTSSALRRYTFFALLIVHASSVVACASETGIVVEVTSPDLSVPSDVDALRFEATGAGGVMAQGVFPIASGWPHSLAIRPPDGEDRGAVSVRVAGLKGGVEVANTTVETAFRSGETFTVNVVLSRCVGASCGPTDGGVDLGVDGGVTDGGVDLGDSDLGEVDLGGDLDLGGEDLGGADLGVTDLGGADLGVDGGPVDLGRDLGPTDLGTDLGAVDAGPVDLGTPSPLLGALVISEVATGGAGGGTDEFIELYNRTDAPLAIGGVTVSYRSSAGASYTPRATVPAAVTLPARSYYLLGAGGYMGTVTPDQPSAWTSGFASSGGHVQIALAGAVIDTLGWGTAIAPEGAAAPGFSGDASRSYERKADGASTLASMTTGADVARGNGSDTDNNATDFVVRATRDPQNAASAAETP